MLLFLTTNMAAVTSRANFLCCGSSLSELHGRRKCQSKGSVTNETSFLNPYLVKRRVNSPQTERILLGRENHTDVYKRNNTTKIHKGKKKEKITTH